MDAWLRRGVRYALTNQRVLILRPPPFASFSAIALDRLPAITLVERPAGRGTIRFGQPVATWGGRSYSWSPALDPTPQLLAIADARRVFDLVQRPAARRP